MTEKRKKAYVETWGCQMNFHRSEGITGELEKANYAITDDPKQADLIVFNTCSVRDRSEQKVLGRIGQIQGEMKQDCILGVGGCMAQRMGNRMKKEIDNVDFVFGTSTLTKIPQLAREARRDKRPVCTPTPTGFEELNPKRNSGYFGWIAISEGCSNACSYCIVPKVRGVLRSRDSEAIINEVDQLVEQDYKEIQLLGQNVNAYGKDTPDNDLDFAWLLDKVAQKDIPRVSFLTPHPADLDRKTLDVMNGQDNIVRHVHLPLQSGSDKVLDIMNRNYTRADFLRLVREVRGVDPKINITTDIIVGHPGETKDDFEQTIEVIKAAEFGSVYGAKFSPRPGTRSAQLDDDVSNKEKEQRLERVLQLQKSVNEEWCQTYLNKETDILVEGLARNNGEVYGKNEFKKTVHFTGTQDQIGKIVPVTIDSVEGRKLYGSVKNKNDTYSYA